VPRRFVGVVLYQQDAVVVRYMRRPTAERWKGGTDRRASPYERAFWGIALVGLLCFLLVGSLYLYRPAEPTVDLAAFFRLAREGSLEVVRAAFCPALAERADGQLLALFIQEVQRQFGPFVRSDAVGMAIPGRAAAGHRIEQFQGTIVFDRREVVMQLHFVDGKLNAFVVDDEGAAAALVAAARVPPDLGPYVRQGARFLAAALEGRYDEAYGLLSPHFRTAVAPGDFAASFARLPRPGRLLRVSHVRADQGAGTGAVVTFRYDCVFERRNVPATVVVQFAGPSSYLSGYEIPAS